VKKAIIIAHGNKPDTDVLKRYIDKDDLIICADGGAEYAFLAGYIPHVVVGDMDSLSKVQQTNLKKYDIEWISYPKHPKYQTDAELAIQHVLKEKFKQIVMFGIYGSRVDQSLATILFIAKQQQFDGQFVIVEDKQEIQIVSKSIEIKGKEGEIFSVIPLQQNATGVSIVRAMYPLKTQTIPYGSTLGISNEFKKSSVKISLQKGVVLVIHQRK